MNTTLKSPEPEQRKSEIKPKVRKAEATEIVDLDDHHHHTPTSKKGTTKLNAISVEQYSEERDLNLAIMASLKASTKVNVQANLIDLSQECYFIDDDDIKVLEFKPETTRFGKRRKIFRDSVTEKGQSSNSINDPEFVCEICVEAKTANQSFSVEGCTHAYCIDCMVKYVASKLQENITNIRCPVSNCKGLLEPEYCRPILPQEVFDRWGNALCEAVILGSQKFYCPFKDCSAMLIDDGEGGQVIRESECPNCRRMFCAQCKVAWHSGINCEEFQKLNKDEREKEDIMLMNLAHKNLWRRCPSCRFYVERTEGCRFMVCRCGTSFCYTCGASTQPLHSHYCIRCNLW